MRAFYCEAVYLHGENSRMTWRVFVVQPERREVSRQAYLSEQSTRSGSVRIRCCVENTGGRKLALEAGEFWVCFSWILSSSGALSRLAVVGFYAGVPGFEPRPITGCPPFRIPLFSSACRSKCWHCNLLWNGTPPFPIRFLPGDSSWPCVHLIWRGVGMPSAAAL
jgi:hypothetical protein